MASVTLPQEASGVRQELNPLTMPEAAKLLSREERFMATVAAMNTLLIEKRVYTQEEFDAIFIRWAISQQSKPRKHRPGWRSKIARFLGL
jgi:hypothetical protein